MKRIVGLLALAALATAPAEAKRRKPVPPPLLAEGQAPQPAVAPGGLPYQLFIPKGYNGNPAERWPLIIFLHGSGERGTDIARVKVHGPPKVADQNPALPFIIISPQLPPSANEDDPWPIPPLNALLDHALKTLKVDPSRVYLTGLSLGGIATWEWGAARPERFAALAPVAGYADEKTACILKDKPVWVFHGDRDDAVDNASDFAMLRAIQKCGGRPRMSLFPDRGHDSWEPAYSDPGFYLWLLEQRLPPKR